MVTAAVVRDQEIDGREMTEKLQRRHEESEERNKGMQVALELTLREKQEAVGAANTVQTELTRRLHDIERMRVEANESEQTIRDLKKLLGAAEESSFEAVRRLDVCERALNIAADDIQLTTVKLGSGSFGGKTLIVSD